MSDNYYRGGRGGGGWQGGSGWNDGGGYSGGRGGRGRGRGGGYYDEGGRGGYSGGGWQGQGQGPRNDRYYQNDYDSSGFRGRGRRGGQQNWGRGSYRSNTWERDKHGREEETLPADVAALTELSGHTNKVTSIQYDPASQQVYTGSADGTVRAWSTVTGQCVSSVEAGGEVDCLLLGGGYLFAGIRKASEGIIKVWNMATAASHLLTGHKGAIHAMVIAGQALVSAGQDNSIRVWNFNQQAGIFMSQAIITKEDGGHSCSVISLTVSGNYMFSADRQGNIVVWDLTTGKAVQRMANAHADQPIMALLMFDAYLISAGMDGLVKAWQVLEQALPGMVVRPDAEYVFDKENPDEGGQQTQQGGGPGRRRPRQPPGIVTMAGTSDAAGTPVLMVAYNGESCVRMFKLPDFSSKGVLTPAGDVRSLGTVPGTVMLTGDGTGRIRVFQWKAVA